MSDDSNSATLNWAELEARSCANGSSSARNIDGENRLERLERDVHAAHDVDVFKSRSLDFDHRKAEALCLSRPTDILQSLRTLIARGFIAEAHQQLNQFLARQPELEHDPEWKLELARLFAFANDWSSCTREATQLLALNPAPLTRMTALQTRSIAYYELQNWDLCRRDLDQILSLGRLYPVAQAVYYAEILAVRLFAATGELARAKQRLKMLWEREIQAMRLDKDRALTLLRAEADLSRYEGQSPRTALLACHWLAEFIGDDQYAALARLDLFCDGDRSANLESRIREDRVTFPRVSSLLGEIESGDPRSTTARSLAGRLKSTGQAVECDSAAGIEIGFSALQSEYQALLIPERKLLITFAPFAVHTVRKLTRPYQALCEIVRGRQQLIKETFFRLLFGPQKYVARIHDHTIHQTLSRIRCQWKIECFVRDGAIAAPSVLLVEVCK
jgi:hypothetical protein